MENNDLVMLMLMNQLRSDVVEKIKDYINGNTSVDVARTAYEKYSEAYKKITKEECKSFEMLCKELGYPLN